MPNFSPALALAAAMIVVTGCGDPDSFSCGTNGGTCLFESELCLLNNGCSTCVPLPVTCDTELVCGCASAAEMAGWSTPCTNVLSCEDSDVGMTLDCPSQDWGCG